MTPFHFPDDSEEWCPAEEPTKEAQSAWLREGANPWQMRLVASGRQWDSKDPNFIRWTISLDREWWRAVWDYLVEAHDTDGALKFWHSFAAPEACRNRQKAFGGTARFNWLEAESVFNTGLSPRIPSPAILAFWERLAARPGNGERDWVEAKERSLGKWLWDAISNGDHGEIRKLSDLVSGKKPPENPDLRGDEKFRILDAFAFLILKHHRLPSEAELLKRATATKESNNFSKLVRELGLSGLPETMPKLA